MVWGVFSGRLAAGGSSDEGLDRREPQSHSSLRVCRHGVFVVHGESYRIMVRCFLSWRKRRGFDHFSRGNT